MTLITVAANNHFIVQLSDRRLTTGDGAIFTEDETKVVYISTPNSQFVMGYTGLARIGKQPTNQILMELLKQALQETDLRFEAALLRFRDLLTEKWKNWAVRRAGVHARISIVLSGFELHGYPKYSGPFQCLITNFQEWGVADHDVPWPAFTSTFLTPKGEWPMLIQRVGAYQALPLAEVEELRERLAIGVPASAVRDSMLNLLPSQSLAYPNSGYTGQLCHRSTVRGAGGELSLFRRGSSDPNVRWNRGDLLRGHLDVFHADHRTDQSRSCVHYRYPETSALRVREWTPISTLPWETTIEGEGRKSSLSRLSPLWTWWEEPASSDLLESR